MNCYELFFEWYFNGAACVRAIKQENGEIITSLHHDNGYWRIITTGLAHSRFAELAEAHDGKMSYEKNPYYPVHGAAPAGGTRGHRIGWLETPGRFQADEWLGPHRETMSESDREVFHIEDAAIPGPSWRGTQPLWRTNPYAKNQIMYRGARRGDPSVLTGPSFFTSAEIFAKTYGPVAPFMLDLQNPKIVDVSEWQDGVGMLEFMSDRHRAEFNQDLEDDDYDSVLANFGDMVVVYLLDIGRATLVE